MSEISFIASSSSSAPESTVEGSIVENSTDASIGLNTSNSLQEHRSWQPTKSILHEDSPIAGDLKNTGDSKLPGDKSSETAVIFDWDDTLLPSSFIVSSQESFSDKLAAVQPLQARVLSLLKRALALSNRFVFILTSSGPGWVQESCRLYYPQVLPLLSKVTIIHANEFCREFAMVNLQFRQYCMSEYFRSPKLASVLAILPALEPEPMRVVLIGDQFADVSIAEALRQRGGDIRTCLFAAEPTARELGRELDWLLNKDMFGRLCVDEALAQRNFALKRSAGASSERSTEDGGSERSSSFSDSDHFGEVPPGGYTFSNRKSGGTACTEPAVNAAETGGEETVARE